jgi:hypothetical protein
MIDQKLTMIRMQVKYRSKKIQRAPSKEERNVRIPTRSIKQIATSGNQKWIHS